MYASVLNYQRLCVVDTYTSNSAWMSVSFKCRPCFKSRGCVIIIFIFQTQQYEPRGLVGNMRSAIYENAHLYDTGLAGQKVKPGHQRRHDS